MKSGRLFRFYAGRLKVIFCIVSKAVVSFSQPLMPGVVNLIAGLILSFIFHRLFC